jgi:hypothetical protein
MEVVQCTKILILTKTLATCEKRSKVWQMYDKPVSSNRIFCKMKVATVLESSLPDSIILRQRGIISVVRRKLMTSCSSVWEGRHHGEIMRMIHGSHITFTRAPTTPRLVSRRYSNGRDLLTVCRKG